MLMKLFLKQGRTRWVDHNEARMLQREGQVICVLEIRNEEIAEFQRCHTIMNDHPSPRISLPD